MKPNQTAHGNSTSSEDISQKGSSAKAMPTTKSSDTKSSHQGSTATSDSAVDGVGQGLTTAPNVALNSTSAIQQQQNTRKDQLMAAARFARHLNQNPPPPPIKQEKARRARERKHTGQDSLTNYQKRDATQGPRYWWR
ncbi:MAG: hypothetical protein Q9168_005974 [Polycauliona sp. 1 TL-2023]